LQHFGKHSKTEYRPILLKNKRVLFIAGAFFALNDSHAFSHFLKFIKMELSLGRELFMIHSILGLGPAYLVVRQDDEGPPAGALHDNGEEFGVDSAECGIPRTLADSYVIVTLFSLKSLTVNVTELRSTNYTERHLKRTDKRLSKTKHNLKTSCLPGWKLALTFTSLYCYNLDRLCTLIIA
jgi:hypothetical protein